MIVCHEQLAVSEAVDRVWGVEQGVRERLDVRCRGIFRGDLEEVEGVA